MMKYPCPQIIGFWVVVSAIPNEPVTISNNEDIR